MGVEPAIKRENKDIFAIESQSKAHIATDLLLKCVKLSALTYLLKDIFGKFIGFFKIWLRLVSLLKSY